MCGLSVIVPTLNEERHVDSLLADVAAQTREPDEVLVVDADSTDETAAVVRRFPFARLLSGEPPVAGTWAAVRRREPFWCFSTRTFGCQRGFFEGLLEDFDRRSLDVACPLYVPYRSTRAVEAFYAVFNLVTRAFQSTLPSGAGHCIALRRDVFRGSRGFDPDLKFDDIELIRRLSRGRRFGIVKQRVLVSDRRYREHGVPRMILRYALMALFFALGRYAWANRMEYEFGGHEH
ncbi:MAG TPA: glycosyltransferase [Rubrobacteraceae bacterium]|nr:glycosyltransferase [Rubrobacteraceae bacterium]